MKELLWLTIGANIFALVFWGWGLLLNKDATVFHTHTHYIIDDGMIKRLPEPHEENM